MRPGPRASLSCPRNILSENVKASCTQRVGFQKMRVTYGGPALLPAGHGVSVLGALSTPAPPVQQPGAPWGSSPPAHGLAAGMTSARTMAASRPCGCLCQLTEAWQKSAPGLGPRWAGSGSGQCSLLEPDFPLRPRDGSPVPTAGTRCSCGQVTEKRTRGQIDAKGPFLAAPRDLP